MSSKRKPAADGKRCRAPKRTDAYPCENRIRVKAFACHKHRGLSLPRIPEYESGPVYVPGYHDELLSSPGSGSSQFDRSLRRATGHFRDNVGPDWDKAVWECGGRMVRSRVWRRAWSKRSGPKTCRRFDELAAASLAGDDLDGFISFAALQAIFPCAGFAELLLHDFLEAFTAEFAAEPAVGTGRAMQLTGIAVCARHGLVLGQCPSARGLLHREGEEVFRRLTAQAEHDWSTFPQLSPG